MAERTPFLDPNHPWFQKAWVRYGTVLLCAVWAFLEFLTGAVFWGSLALGAGLYAAWVLIIQPRRKGSEP